tara:strand:+ start:37 stop:747 length:711 start_codon:yes stop_codon:yes gene_type:complete
MSKSPFYRTGISRSPLHRHDGSDVPHEEESQEEDKKAQMEKLMNMSRNAPKKQLDMEGGPDGRMSNPEESDSFLTQAMTLASNPVDGFLAGVHQMTGKKALEGGSSGSGANSLTNLRKMNELAKKDTMQGRDAKKHLAPSAGINGISSLIPAAMTAQTLGGVAQAIAPTVAGSLKGTKELSHSKRAGNLASKLLGNKAKKAMKIAAGIGSLYYVYKGGNAINKFNKKTDELVPKKT